MTLDDFKSILELNSAITNVTIVEDDSDFDLYSLSVEVGGVELFREVRRKDPNGNHKQEIIKFLLNDLIMEGISSFKDKTLYGL